MDLKGIADLKNAFNQIHCDLIFLRQKTSEENIGIFNEINLMISFIRQNENYIEKNAFINDNQPGGDNSVFSTLGETENIWRYYKEILQQIFQCSASINGLSILDINKNQLNGDYDPTQNSYLHSKIYIPLQHTINGNNWSQICNQIGSENITMITPGSNTLTIPDGNKNTFRSNIYATNKINSGVNELFTMHGAGDSVSIRRSKLPPQPEKDIEEIQQTISMQLKLQQHHSKNRYKFQPTHRAWPITPEINVVFQGTGSTNQFPIQNQLFSTNSETQIYTPSTIVGLHTQYQSQPPNVSHLLNHSITASNNAFYGFNNAYTGQLTNNAILQTNDSDFAQLPSSMFGFLNNSSTNRIPNCHLSGVNSTNNGINTNNDNIDVTETISGQGTNFILNNNIGSKSFENQGSSKICESKSNLINYHIKASTLTWEDLANVTTTSTN